MSDTNTKEKRSKRLYKDKVKIEKQLKLAKMSYLASPEDNILVKEPHRMNKIHAFNCGNPDCVMCGNPRKFFKEETMQEKSFKQQKLHEE